MISKPLPFIFAIIILCLSTHCLANECLERQKNRVISYPYFRSVDIDDEDFDDFTQINENIKALIQDSDVFPEYWAGNFKHYVHYSKNSPGHKTNLINWIYEGDDGSFFIERLYGVNSKDFIDSTIQTFKVSEDCKRTLVNSTKQLFYINDKRIVEKRYIDGELEVQTVEVDAMPEMFDVFTAPFILEFEGQLGTSAYVMLEIPYSKVTISDSYQDAVLEDRIVGRKVTVDKKHVQYDYEKIGRLTVDVFESPYSFYKKLVLNGAGLTNKVFERVTRDMWIESQLNELQTRVTFNTALGVIDKKGNVSPYKLTSNMPLEHENLANYPYIKSLGLVDGGYVYEVLPAGQYDPVKIDEVVPERYLKSTYYINSDSPAIKHYAELINDDVENRMEMFTNILLFVNHFALKYNYDQRDNGNVRFLTTDQILASGKGVCQHYTNIVVALCRAKGIPARMIRGYLLENDKAVDHAWVEVFIDNAWLPFEPQTRMLRNTHVSNRYVPVVVSDIYESMSNINDFDSAFEFLDYRFEVDSLPH